MKGELSGTTYSPIINFINDSDYICYNCVHLEVVTNKKRVPLVGTHTD